MKFHLGTCIEVYITNNCNLTCSNCNRYNNYNFTGNYSPEDSKSAVEKWSKRITANLITIIGGEPTLHPNIGDWIDLLCTAWPDVPVMVQTNGTIWNRDLMEPFSKKYKNFGVGVAVHTAKSYTKLAEKFVPPGLPEQLFPADEFTECALVDQGTHFTVHDGDPIKAFLCCTMSHSHTLLNGRLYRCPMVAVLPEFRKQYQVTLTPEQETLLNSYQSLSADCSDEEISEFIASRDTPLPQCQLCPGSYNLSTVTFDPTRKKRQKIN